MTFDTILQKLKANLNYALCAFLGLFHFVMLAFNYVSAFVKWGGEREVDAACNGYKLMQFAEFEGSDANVLAVFSGIFQILLLVLAVAMLAVGVMGLLKAFGIFEQFPDKVDKYETKKLAGFALLGYTAITFLIFVFMIIWTTANTKSLGSLKGGFCLGFGMYFVLIFGGLLAAAPYVLPKYVSGLNEETVSGPQMTYRCEKCGKKAGKNEKFCSVCGGAVVAEVVKQYNYVCSGCGKKMKKTDKFCSVCGGAVVAVEVKQMEYVCSNCGKKMKKTDKFCNVCGGAVVEREVVLAPSDPV